MGEARCNTSVSSRFQPWSRWEARLGRDDRLVRSLSILDQMLEPYFRTKTCETF